MTRSHQRRGFTLVEMLVVMGIIVLISAAAMLVVPAALNKDRSTDAVTNVKLWLEIAQARAARDGAPRGLRFIVDPTKLSPISVPPSPTGSDERLWVTEVQYIEAPPVLVFNPNPPYPNGFVGTVPNLQPHPLTPRVEFVYTVAGPPAMATDPPQGTIINRQCFIRGLTFDQGLQVINATGINNQPTLWLPVLGTWHRIFATIPDPATGANPRPDPAVNPTSYFVEVRLSDPSDLTTGYPDMQLGASTYYVTYHFGIYAPARPLLGEPTMQLPTNTCVDLTNDPNPAAPKIVSTPGIVPNQPSPLLQDYDILFAPSGSVAFTPTIGGAPQIFLCVRDPRRGSPMNLFDANQIRQGGEMMILGIKSRSGAITAQPVDLNGDPYSFAKQSISGQ
jgi:prepilin-type N-terminal cleavage/methylation domain-containing protein